jgi:glycosyltransferase involved in cell wall biosynthesis
MKISIILASYLGEYEANGHKCATDRLGKLNRAIASVLFQTYTDWELIVVSDGCELTNQAVAKMAEHYDKIKLIKLEKQPLFSGNVRQSGLEAATGGLVCYLDSDDFFGKEHLGYMFLALRGDYFSKGIYLFKSRLDCDPWWYYYDDFLHYSKDKIERRPVQPLHSHIGTSSFCHWRETPVVWGDGYGHDWRTIEGLLHLTHAKIEKLEYNVCHVSAYGLDY